MANTDTPYGFKYISGPAKFRFMTKLAAYGAAIGLGDPVVWAGTRNNIQVGATTVAFLGASMSYSPTLTLSTHPVIIAQADTMFLMQEDGNAGVNAEGATADVVVSTPTAATGVSNCEVSSSTVDVTATHDVKLYKVAPFADNDGTAANSKWFVFMNNISMGTQIAGV